MQKAPTRSTILKSIDCRYLKLFRRIGRPGWTFVYDDGKLHIAENVHRARLSDMSLDHWVEVGKSFVRGIEDPH